MTPAINVRLMSFRKYFLVSLLVGITPFLQAREDATVEEWLERMERAMHELRYEGVFVYLHDNQLELMRLIHTVEVGKEQERLISLNGAPREVVRDDYSVICVLPGRRLVSVGQRDNGNASHKHMPLKPSELSRYYDFRLVGDGRVAGRPTKVLTIIPRDSNRYGQRLYLDLEYALPLKSDLLETSGEPVTQVMFTSLRVDPGIRDIHPEVEEARAEDRYAWINEQPKQRMDDLGKDIKWNFLGVPDGFRFRTHLVRPATQQRGMIEHFVFSDGLATFSVYIEKSGAHHNLQGSSQMGAVNAFGTQVRDYQVTVVGEVPAETIEKIAGAIEYRAVQ